MCMGVILYLIHAKFILKNSSLKIFKKKLTLYPLSEISPVSLKIKINKKCVFNIMQKNNIPPPFPTLS